MLLQVGGIRQIARLSLSVGARSTGCLLVKMLWKVRHICRLHSTVLSLMPLLRRGCCLNNLGLEIG